MILQILKRDGTPVPYDKGKISVAITKANATVDEQDRANSFVIEEIINEIEKRFDGTVAKVEEIQDIIEKNLFDNGLYNLGTKYHDYRFVRAMMRNITDKTNANRFDSVVLGLANRDIRQIETSDLDVKNAVTMVRRENSNKDDRNASTQRDLIAGEVSKDLTKRILLPKEISEAHDKGQIHFHDADYFLQTIFNCCLINISDMLDNGTVMNEKTIDPPKSFQVACTVMTQIIACVASNQYGGQSVDIMHLAKYIRISYEKYLKHYKEMGIADEKAEMIAKDRTKSEVKSGVQTVQYQINTLMTTNGQTPFVTLFMHINVGDEYEEEEEMLIKEVLQQRLEGIKNIAGVYVTPPFPKLVYVLDEDNCLEGGKYDYLTELAVECSAKRMYPDYISAKKMKETYGAVFSPMGCRSFLSPWKDENGNLKWEGRFNQGVVSLNLPRIAIEATAEIRAAKEYGSEITEQMKEDAMLKFWEILDDRLNLCYKALMERHKALLGVTSDISPIHWQHGAIARLKKGEKIDRYLKGGYSTLSLGYIGVYEMTLLMTGESQTQPTGHEFSIKVMNYLKAACDKWKANTGLAFALYGTPAESLCYRFAFLDGKEFGNIENVTDKKYYTNSYHVDVREKIDAFSKFSFESEYQKISTGGCISYVEVPFMMKNLEAMKSVVKFIYNNIQYAEFNTKSDNCHVCGFDGEIIINDNNQWECPCCHNTDEHKMTVTRRTCGYLGANYWNYGKTLEIKSRVTHL